MRIRTRKSVAAAPTTVDPLAYEATTGVLPPVLTVSAVTSGLMPPLGVSALPPTLEAVVPPSLRFWKAATDAQARAVRDELVEREVFKERDVALVDGVPRLLVAKLFLADDAPMVDEPLAERLPISSAAASVLVATDFLDVSFVEVDAPDLGLLAELRKKVEGPILVSTTDDATTRAELAKTDLNVFVLATRPGHLFASSAAIVPSSTIAKKIDATSKSHLVRLIRKDATTEERFILGVVLEPDVVDSQGDTYSADAVRKAAHYYMEKTGGALGQQHEQIVTGKLVVLESYLAPVDMTIGTHVVKAGTWLLGVRVVDDALWESVKDGSFTGFSIGGTAVRRPETLAA